MTGKNKPSKEKPVSELRRDLVSGSWVAIATSRAKRPDEFAKVQKSCEATPVKDCPFEDPQKSGNGEPLLVLPDRNGKGKDWWVQVVRNKFPAFSPVGLCGEIEEVGPYVMMDGYGFHEVVITRDHTRHWANFSQKEAEMTIVAYRSRYLALAKENCVRYISIFHNHGKEAGASLYHPHSQIAAIPVIDPDVSRSLLGSQNYYSDHKKCVHCVMINYERDQKTRIIFENDLFIVFCPFVSRSAFEVRIFPKVHEPSFEQMDDEQLGDFAEALRVSLKKICGALNDPPYNFYIHTAPAGGNSAKEYAHYHWHLEILPKTAVWAGFELGAGIEISTIEPEKAAQYLRKF